MATRTKQVNSTPMALAQYIATVASEAAHGVAETTHYPALKELLNAAGDELSPKVRAIIHPGGTATGLPDGALWSAHLLAKPGQPGLDLFGPKDKVPDRGGVEAKGLDQNIQALANSYQLRKYLPQLRQVLVTNFREFAVVQLRDGKPVIIEEYSLAPSKTAFLGMTDSDAKHHERLLKEFLRRAMSAQTALAAPGEVAFFLASHAREARARLDQFENPLELEALKQALEKALGIQFAGDKGDAFFRAELIQTLFYGLFSTWVLWHEENPTRSDSFDYILTSRYLRVPVIDRLYNAASSRRVLEQTKLVHSLRNASDTLNRVDRTTFFQAFDQGLAVQYFYEPFLAAFDPQLRKDLGVWYTPPEIVRGMVAKCDRLLIEELGEPDGLAGDRVLLLAPCCGTGAFVVEALRVAADRWAARGEPYADRLRNAATKRMFGFELLTGPFVVAHLQVAFLLAKHKAPLQEEERAAIYLTNALTGWEPVAPERRALDPLALNAESERAHEVKRDEQILVVIGNPPYSGYAGISSMEEERALSDRYRPERSRGQGLNDLYVRFFAMADRRIQTTGKGLVCLISNYSWLDGLSFARMREILLAGFHRIEIDNLNGDKYATGKTTPEGSPDPSVFSTEFNREGIQVGTAVTTLIRRGALSGPASVLYRDFWGVNKRSNFRAGAGQYTSITPSPDLGRPLRPRTANALFLTWPKLPELFPVSMPGVKTSRDDLLVDIDRPRLEKRIRDYFDPRIPDAEIERSTPGTMVSNTQYDANGIRRTLQRRGIREDGFRRYLYRPFDARWLYWEEQTKLLDRGRPDFVAQVGPDNIWLEAREHDGSRDPRRGIVTRCLADQIGNGMSSWFPMTVTLTPNGLASQTPLIVEPAEQSQLTRFNLSDEAKRALQAHNLADKAETLFFHALALLHSPAYAAENAGALLQDWPRIPISRAAAHDPREPALDSETRDWLIRGAALGRRVAELLDIENAVAGIEAGALAPELHSVARFEWSPERQYRENTDDTALSAGWGYHGQNGVIMPGTGKTVQLGDGTRDVVINDKARWTGVPEAVWNYHLGGYQVLKKWLSYREAKVLGRPLTLEEIRTFSAIARRIAALITLGPELDEHYRAACMPSDAH